ncbi:SDR family NAD(P)-dependent oxidoreductase [Streptomyces sp. Mo3]|uniref:SDR family NAD(P)-dependent oxidoreductase n=1 Tax=Streptomyces sp. Mo3 TaxID=3161190 RepID=UPI0039F0A7CF|nr:SDR family oxidoreductase [Streptomyces antimycoticus]
MSGRLDGKVAIITGAARGQGLAATRIFQAEGAKVAMLDLDGEKAAAAAGELGVPGLLPLACDVADAASVRAAVARVMEEFGRIDVLYNNAGANFRRPGPRDDSQDGPTIDLTEEVFDKSIGVNLKSVFLMGKYVLPHMIEGGGGSVINIASLAGHWIGAPNHAYTAAKAGVIGMTRAVAQTYGVNGIRANVITPGLIQTELVANILADEAWRDSYAQGTPLRKLGEPEDIARVALFLASEDSAFMTGSVLTADAGYMVR